MEEIIRKTVDRRHRAMLFVNNKVHFNEIFYSSNSSVGRCSAKEMETVQGAVKDQSKCNQNVMLTLDESFLEALDVEDVEKEYWDAKPKKPKLENTVSKSSVSRCSSPELFLEDDFGNDISDQSISIMKSSETLKELSSEASYFDPSVLKFHADKGQHHNGLNDKGYSNEGHLIDDDQTSRVHQVPSKWEMPLKEKIKKALLENAHKASTNLKSMIDEELPKNILKDVNEKKGESKYFELGPFYGLPTKVKDLIQKSKGIDKLYCWQEECLNLQAVQERKNLVYSLPTSGGKTLVAEIFMLRELLCRKKNVIFVLPYVAIVQEKVRSLAPFGVELEFLVEEYAAGKGNFPPRKRRHKNVIYIATIEKAHGLANSLLEEGRLAEVGLVVVDELHLVGEKGGRGTILESFLIKLLYSKEDIHIVGMSATIGNLPEIATFLKAEIFCKDFRPVELKEYVKLENGLWAINRNSLCPEEEFKLIRKVQFQYSPHMSMADPDQLGGLVVEVVPNHSCLVFCPTKKNCENVAMLICQVMPRDILDHKIEEKKSLYKALLNEGNGSICSVLKKILPFGVAYHHSGLTGDERRLIEEAYTMGTLSCICCTSTLAAGVNLPAKRVILRSPYIGNQFINLSRYKQMIGRAGRAGFDTHGESILICKSTEVDKVRDLLKSNMDEAITSLHEKDGQGAGNLVLSSVGLGLASSRNSLQNIFSNSLLHVQAKRHDIEVRDVVDKAIARLLKIKMLVISNPPPSQPQENNIKQNDEGKGGKSKTIVLLNDTKLLVSKLGKAAIKGCIDLTLADQLYKDLRQAQSGLVLLNALHLLYLVTPYDVVMSIKTIPNIYYKVYMELSPQDLQTAHVVGINEICIMRLVSGKSLKGISKHVLNRFYVTLMLYDLWNQVSVWEVSHKYETQRGLVQSLMNKSAAFASNVLHFCQEFEEFWAFQDLLLNFSKRLSHCCHPELLPLMDLPAVKRGRARQLYNAGFKNLRDIANSTPQHLIKSVDHMSRKVAQQIIAAAKLILLEKVESLREEAEDVLEGLVNYT